MIPLISAAEVAEEAFGGVENVRAEAISNAVINAAQRKFIRPVFGSMTDAMEQGNYVQFVNTYIKPPLAMYVKLLMLPSLSTQVGMEGVVKYEGYGFESADSRSLRKLLRRIRSDADTLIDIAVETIESATESYPEYDPKKNIRKRIRMDGNIVL